MGFKLELLVYPDKHYEQIVWREWRVLNEAGLVRAWRNYAPVNADLATISKIDQRSVELLINAVFGEVTLRPTEWKALETLSDLPTPNLSTKNFKHPKPSSV